MKTAIIYYSRTGNTRHVVQLLENKMKEKKLDVDIIEIQAVKRPGFLGAGRAAMKELELPIVNEGVDLKQYDLLIIGSPVWGGMPSPFIKTFLSKAKNVKGKQAAWFIAGGGAVGSHEKTKSAMKRQLEETGLNVIDSFLELKMGKGKILEGEQQIDGFIASVTGS